MTASIEPPEVTSVPGYDKALQPHQARVVAEHIDLADKINKLEAFTLTKVFTSLPDEEQIRLRKQLAIMRPYREVLAARIQSFDVLANVIFIPTGKGTVRALTLPATASQTPLTEDEEIMLYLYRRVQLLETSIAELL